MFRAIASVNLIVVQLLVDYITQFEPGGEDNRSDAMIVERNFSTVWHGQRNFLSRAMFESTATIDTGSAGW